MKLFDRIEHARNYLLRNKEFLAKIQKIYDDNNTSELKTLYYHKSLDYNRSSFKPVVDELKKLSGLERIHVNKNEVITAEITIFPYTDVIIKTPEHGIKISSRYTGDPEKNTFKGNDIVYRTLDSFGRIQYGKNRYGTNVDISTYILQLELDLPKDITTWTTEDLILLRMAIED